MLNKFPNLAVNGRVDGECSQTNYEEDPWWRVDLQDEYHIMAVGISNCCNNIMETVDVRVGNDENRELNKICGRVDGIKDEDDRILLCPSDLSGRYVHLGVRGRNKSLSICEVRVYHVLGNSCIHFVFVASHENLAQYRFSCRDTPCTPYFYFQLCAIRMTKDCPTKRSHINAIIKV